MSTDVPEGCSPSTDPNGDADAMYGSRAVRRGIKRVWSALTSVPVVVFLLSVGFVVLFADEHLGTTVWVVVTAVVGLLAFLGAVTGDSSCEIRIDELQDQTIEVDGGRMRAIDEEGEVVATIDLSAPFKVTVPYVGNGKGVYRVEQDGQRLEFSSTMDGAEHLVKGVLGLKSWPPDADFF